MAVAVFGQLDRLLRQRSLTLDELRRQIEDLYGMTVDPRALDQLVDSQDLQRADMKVIGAVASILNVSLNDLLLVVALPTSTSSPQDEPSFLDAEETGRLWELLDMQSCRKLSKQEKRELEILIYDKYGQRSIDYYRRKEAERRGVSLEQVQREEDERIAGAVRYGDWLDADPRRRQELADHVKRRKAFV